MSSQNIRQSMPLRSADIDQRSESPEGIARGDLGAFGAIDAGHEPAHQFATFRIAGDVLKEGHAIGRRKSRGAGLENGRQLLPALQNRVIVQYKDHLPKGRRRAVAHVV